jgi:hypothetical protein
MVEMSNSKKQQEPTNYKAHKVLRSSCWRSQALFLFLFLFVSLLFGCWDEGPAAATGFDLLG